MEVLQMTVVSYVTTVRRKKMSRWKCPICDRKYDFEDEMVECINNHPDKYRKGFNIMMEYWDSIDKEEQKLLDKRLEEIGL